jgi:hypothetical protein
MVRPCRRRRDRCRELVIAAPRALGRGLRHGRLRHRRSADLLLPASSGRDAGQCDPTRRWYPPGQRRSYPTSRQSSAAAWSRQTIRSSRPSASGNGQIGERRAHVAVARTLGHHNRAPDAGATGHRCRGRATLRVAGRPLGPCFGRNARQRLGKNDRLRLAALHDAPTWKKR